MITCHALDGGFDSIDLNGFDMILSSLSENKDAIENMPTKAIVEILSRLGRSIVRDKALARLEGVSYMSLWLRRENLEHICRLNFGDTSYLDDFVPSGKGVSMCAQPRGIICHWVAGNVPTLSFFSLVMGILTKNSNILKVSESNKDGLLSLIRCLSELQVEIDGHRYLGSDIAKTISVISFDSADNEQSELFSRAADCKIIWGGAESVRAVTALPQKETCEIIPLGPKYSFGVFDRERIKSQEFRQDLRMVLRDILLFNQMACSSANVLFFERGGMEMEEVVRIMMEEFDALPKKLLERPIPQHIASQIIRVRWEYLLSDGKSVAESRGLDWTILANSEPGLEEPIHGGCVFVKEVHDILDTIPHITRKIQAIVLCVEDDQRRREYARLATRRGADRIVLPGGAHDFTLPWDGIMILNRLVRWTTLFSDSARGESNVEG